MVHGLWSMVYGLWSMVYGLAVPEAVVIRFWGLNQGFGSFFLNFFEPDNKDPSKLETLALMHRRESNTVFVVLPNCPVVPGLLHELRRTTVSQIWTNESIYGCRWRVQTCVSRKTRICASHPDKPPDDLRR